MLSIVLYVEHESVAGRTAYTPENVSDTKKVMKNADYVSPTT